MTFVVFASRPVRTSVAGAGILACLLLLMLSALTGCVGHSAGDVAQIPGSVVVQGHDVATSLQSTDRDPCEGHGTTQHDSSVAVGLPAQPVASHVASTVSDNVSAGSQQLPLATVNARSNSLTPVQYLLCVLRT